MVKAWDEKDYKLCSFKYIMFNDLSQAGADGLMIPPAADVLQRERAQALNAADTGLWERADAQNPNPSRFVPVQVTGFNALQERRAQQQQAARDISKKLHEAQETLRALADERRVAIDLRLRHYHERQQTLSHRVLRLYAALERQHLLRCHGGVEPPLASGELGWISRLRELVHEMERPDGGLTRLYDLSTQMARDAAAAAASGGAGAPLGLPAASQLQLAQLEEWLSRQQAAVRTLIEVSQRDLKDVAIAMDEVHAEISGAARASNGGAAALMAIA